MKPLIVLLTAFAVSQLAIYLIKDDWYLILSGNIAMCLMLCFSSIGHFAFPKGMSMMLPAFVPFKKLLVWLTGFMEIAFGILLLIPNYRVVTGWCLILFLILLLPANIYAAQQHIDFEKGNHNGKGLRYLWFRVPLQLFFIGWIYVFSVCPIMLVGF